MIWYESFIFLGIFVVLCFIWLIGKVDGETALVVDSTHTPNPPSKEEPNLLTAVSPSSVLPKVSKPAKKISEPIKRASLPRIESKPPPIYPGEELEPASDRAHTVKEVQPIFEDNQGNKLFPNDLVPIQGAWVNYEADYQSEVAEGAQSLLREAQVLSTKSKYGDAMDKLREAARMAPGWPSPYYERARLFTKMDNQTSAYEAYKKVDELAPRGYYETKTAIHTLEGELNNVFRRRTFREFQRIDAFEKRELKLSQAQNMVKKQPHFSAAWRILANLYQDPEKRSHCIEEGLKGEYDQDTYGNLLINKALILNINGEKSKAKNLLGELIFAVDSTTGTIGMAKFALNSILR